MNPAEPTTKVPPADQRDVRNPLFGRFYHYVLARSETEPDPRARRRLLDGLEGRILEVGPGNGPNFKLYPASVVEVIAVEPEPYLRARAGEAALKASVAVSVVAVDAEHLPVEDGSVDAVVMALVLCSVPDQHRALTEVRRVLRPGGELRVYEHVVAENPIAKAAQRAAQATFWPRAFGGCHPARDTLATLRTSGFDVTEVRRFVMRAGPEPPMPYILAARPLGTGHHRPTAESEPTNPRCFGRRRAVSRRFGGPRHAPERRGLQAPRGPTARGLCEAALATLSVHGNVGGIELAGPAGWRFSGWRR